MNMFDFAPSVGETNTGNYNATSKRRAMWDAMNGAPLNAEATIVYTPGVPVAPQRVRFAPPKGPDII